MRVHNKKLKQYIIPYYPKRKNMAKNIVPHFCDKAIDQTETG